MHVVRDVGLCDTEHVEYVHLSISHVKVCVHKSSAAPRLVAGTRVILVSHKDPGDAGSSSK